MLKISVNNRELSVGEDCNLLQLITIAGFAEQKIALAINGEFVAKNLYPTTKLAQRDNVDIVTPIGGG
ncbi:MAG: sulfur carrier protein ThiS [Pseudomonadales bacterium]|nr:sulfur carrier protein ThiS [Pseudomonadales bacterium]NRA13929.1 sulfur carrier protein ThiS [Oceanospirillaceae bacterium]